MNAREYWQGFDAGLRPPAEQGFCPYDGRTRGARAWWRGFVDGEARRIAQHFIDRAHEETK